MRGWIGSSSRMSSAYLTPLPYHLITQPNPLQLLPCLRYALLLLVLPTSPMPLLLALMSHLSEITPHISYPPYPPSPHPRPGTTTTRRAAPCGENTLLYCVAGMMGWTPQLVWAFMRCDAVFGIWCGIGRGTVRGVVRYGGRGEGRVM
jgi:hypothetical protein